MSFISILATRGYQIWQDQSSSHVTCTLSLPIFVLTTTQVGGSLAGLMHGIILKKSGFQVHVLERNASEALESQAAGIRVGPEIYDFM